MSRVIARRFTTLNADTALLAGLLQCIGKLYLLTRAARYPALLGDDAALERITSEYHLRVAQAILRNWDMDPEIVKAIGACENHRARTCRRHRSHRRARRPAPR